MTFNVPKLRKLLSLMQEYEVSKLEIEEEGTRILLEKNGGQATIANPQVVLNPAVQTQTEAPAEVGTPLKGQLTSPIIGTFYASPEPSAKAYVQIGDEVQPDTVVCIIEAMKVMNEIKADSHGVITAVHVEDAQPVEYGQLLFSINPSA